MHVHRYKARIQGLTGYTCSLGTMLLWCRTKNIPTSVTMQKATPTDSSSDESIVAQWHKVQTVQE